MRRHCYQRSSGSHQDTCGCEHPGGSYRSADGYRQSRGARGDTSASGDTYRYEASCDSYRDPGGHRRSPGGHRRSTGTADAYQTAPRSGDRNGNGPPTETPAPIQGPVVRIGDALFPVDLALTPEQRSQGLSGREVMAAETGMLFIFENEGTFSFWMKEMHFPLDIVWIGADCTVVDVTLGAPPS